LADLRVILRFCGVSLAGLFAIALLAFALAVPAAAQGIDVKQFSLEPSEGAYVVNASFELLLTPRLEDVLDNGVPLPFVIEFELIRPRWYWFDEKTATDRLDVQLSFNPLLRQYRVSTGNLHRNFTSLADALNIMSGLRSWAVFDRDQVQPNTTYVAALRMRLDAAQLPKAFQLSAITDRDLSLASEWKRIAFTPGGDRQP
jgi:hypothetical protein